MDDFEKDDFELELEKENEGYELVLENETEEVVEKSKIKRLKKLPKVKPKIKVDVENFEVGLFVEIPKIKLCEADVQDKKKGYEQVETLEYVNNLVFKKKFNILGKEITVDNKNYQIPQYFNLDLIAQNNSNVLERLFYKIFYERIVEEIKKYNL